MLYIKYTWTKYILKIKTVVEDFLDGPVVKNLLSNAGEVGLMPDFEN